MPSQDHPDHTVQEVSSLDDPRIADYRDLKDRDLARQGQKFLAEGELIVRRLLGSDYPVESVLVDERYAAQIAPLAPAGVPVYAAERGLMDRIIGFRFHLGVIAVGRRRPGPSLEDLARSWSGPATVLVLPEIIATENLGAILRIAGAFGADAVLLGPRCCDPFYRQSVRVSMGAVFRLKIVRCADLLGDLGRLRQQWGFQLAAAVLDGDAEPLPQASRPPRLALLLGSEARGLPPEVLAACDRRITLPMKLGVDSLNVAIAAAVFLYHFGR